VAGAASALVLAAFTALGTGIGNTILGWVKPHPDPSGPPVVVESVGAIQPWQDYSYVVPGKLVFTPAQLAVVNSKVSSSASDYGHWFHEHSGVIANKGILGITVRGNGTGPVTITDMQVVKHCTAPLTNATLFYSPTEGAGPFNTDQIGFDLGQQVSIGQYVPAPSAHPHPAGGNFFTRKVITLRPGEPQTLSVFVSTENEYCHFTFQLHVATPEQEIAAITITDHGKPFEMTTDGKAGFTGTVPFGSYRAVYAGGAADMQNRQAFIRVDPATYKGSGNPKNFPAGLS
jgi:hypothetical protein